MEEEYGTLQNVNCEDIRPHGFPVLLFVSCIAYKTYLFSLCLNFLTGKTETTVTNVSYSEYKVFIRDAGIH